MIENKRIKIGIISDTHGLLRTEVLDILQSCDCIFHAGDVDRPELLDTIRSLGALYVVRGNNDGYWAQNLRRSLNFTVGNVKFFMVHDRKDVAWELGDTQVVIFGHSHQYFAKEKDIVTGVVQRYVGENVSVSLDDKTDALLMKSEQIKGEVFKPTERIKLYIVEVKETNRGPRILVSRTHPDLVKRLFEKEVAEIQDGTVEIKNIVREAGSRTKMAVCSHDENVDAVGACVGVNGARVNAVVDELRDEKIDIVNWSENPAILIENALSPSKVVAVLADPDNKEALVVVPDFQLALAIGKEGQNARLAAKLTGFKIDIKSESQAKEEGIQYVFDDDEYYDDEYYDDEYDAEYDDEYYDDEYDSESEADSEESEEVTEETSEATTEETEE